MLFNSHWSSTDAAQAYIYQQHLRHLATMLNHSFSIWASLVALLTYSFQLHTEPFAVCKASLLATYLQFLLINFISVLKIMATLNFWKVLSSCFHSTIYCLFLKFFLPLLSIWKSSSIFSLSFELFMMLTSPNFHFVQDRLLLFPVTLCNNSFSQHGSTLAHSLFSTCK